MFAPRCAACDEIITPAKVRGKGNLGELQPQHYYNQRINLSDYFVV
jgi:hypothetical protein